MDTLPVGIERKYETKNWRRSKMRELQRKVLFLLEIILEKEDQVMDPDNRITIKTLLTDLIPIMGRIVRTVDDRLTDDQINFPTETMEIDRTTELTITKMELGEIMAILLVHHLDRDGTFLKAIPPADLNPFNLEIHHLEDQTVIQTLVLLLTNKIFRKPTIKHQGTWSGSPPLMIALTNYQNSVR